MLDFLHEIFSQQDIKNVPLDVHNNFQSFTMMWMDRDLIA